MSLFANENPALGSRATAGGNIIQNQEPILVYIGAATVSQTVFVADGDYELTAVSEVHGTASTSGTLQVEKLTGTTAPGSGTVMLTGTISLSATANTVVAGTLVTNNATLRVASGDRIGVKIAGTMTNLVGAVATLTLKKI